MKRAEDTFKTEGKALIYCLVAIVVVGAIVLVGFIRGRSTSYYETAEYQKRAEDTKDIILEAKEHFAEYSDTAIIIAIQEIEKNNSSSSANDSEANNSSVPYADYQDAWDEQQMEEAMNSIGEEAMQEYMREEAKEQETYVTDPLFN